MVLRLFSLLTIPVTLLGFWGVARQLRKPQRLTASSVVISAVMAPLMLLINLLFLNRAAPGCAGLALLVLGVGFGLAWGRTTKLEAAGETVVARRSVLHLVFWAISYALTQLLSMLGDATLVMGGLAAMFFSTGTTLGTQASLWRRRRRLRGESGTG